MEIRTVGVVIEAVIEEEEAKKKLLKVGAGPTPFGRRSKVEGRRVGCPQPLTFNFSTLRPTARGEELEFSRMAYPQEALRV